MLLLEPEPTQFDLKWRMFGIPVRVHPLFWVLSAILGWSWVHVGIEYLLLWIVCVFVSILVHELGHVFMGRFFGAYGHIVLFSFGGLAIGSSNLPGRWQRVAVYLGGPLAQFVLYGLVRLFFEFAFPYLDVPRGLRVFLGLLCVQLMLINLYWPLLNLLPIWPLDGGRISRELLEWLLRGRGVRVSLGISLVVAGLLAINSLVAATRKDHEPLIPFLYTGGVYMAVMFALLAVGNFQAMQMESDNRPWERDQDYWRR